MRSAPPHTERLRDRRVSSLSPGIAFCNFARPMNDELAFEQLPVDDDEILVEPAVDPFPSTVLVVDEHPGVRTRLRERLWNAGFQVREAATALAAHEIALSEQIDVALVEVALPDTDGWGLLSVFRDDARLCEIKVVLMSAQRGQLEELSRLQVGADGYASKNGDLIGPVRSALERRQRLVSTLPRGTWGLIGDVGLQSLLHAICRMRLVGMLSVDDGATTWQVAFDDGVVASARAFCLDSETTLFDLDALLPLLEVEEAPFTFEPVDGSDIYRTLGKPWSEIAAALGEQVNAKRARTRAYLLSLDKRLAFDVPRLRWWARRSPAPLASVANALYSGARPRALLEQSSYPRSSVEFVVLDLLRRKVARCS